MAHDSPYDQLMRPHALYVGQDCNTCIIRRSSVVSIAITNSLEILFNNPYLILSEFEAEGFVCLEVLQQQY